MGVRMLFYQLKNYKNWGVHFKDIVDCQVLDEKIMLIKQVGHSFSKMHFMLLFAQTHWHLSSETS